MFRNGEMKVGTEFVVLGFEEDSPIVAKLRCMGLRKGKKAKVLIKNGRAYLLKLDNTRLVIDEELLSKVKKEVC
ncbi:MAG TPA: ferrous iron transport protein A [Aquificaceae bacterium]|nr:ferrous iron transport protein A [Aquificaceae bacterium]